jgi:hypothetical protein
MSQGSGPSLPVLAPGHGKPRGTSPFASAAPSIVAALVYAAALVVWVVVGDPLPGGRTFAIHLFTLGVLTNLVLTFSEHFARTVTRTPGERAWWWPAVTNLGIVLVLAGLPARFLPAIAAGSTILVAVVFLAYVRMRRMRKAAIGARFAWIVRIYERAHGAFIHGATLGALMGIVTLAGPWFVGVRFAHLHANILGWGGLTLLATLVFFGPTMARTRIEPGADERAARLLRHAATGLSVAVLALVLTGFGGAWGTGFRWLAAAGLAGYAFAATFVCLPVGRAVWSARVTAARPLVVGVCVWFPLMVWADVGFVATASWRWMDALGVVALTGVLGQAILATLVYLAPMLRGRSTGSRETIRIRLEVGARTRAVVMNLGVAIAAIGAARLVDGPLLGIGGAVVLATMVVTVIIGAWPLRGSPEGATSGPA